MKQFRLFVFVVVSALALSAKAETPIYGLLERIDKGAAKKFVCQIENGEGKDFFELDQMGNKVVVRGNTYVNIAVGINWYLKYYAGIHITWNQMKAKLPEVLPRVPKLERHETDLKLRYDFNYCTFSYSMAFWDWDRWQKEIDWMALHGINIPLAAVGNECVWRNVLLKLGYSESEVGKFIAGPAFLAWWEMNNLEGWGGPLPLSWYKNREILQKRILKRMREFGMKPVLPGYAGMVPSFQAEKMESSQEAASIHNGERLSTDGSSESNLSSLQLWNGFTRPGVLMPDDSRFDRYASLYYAEMKKLYGTSDFYSMDPFHEASNLPKNLNLGEAGKKVLNAMKEYGKQESTWVIQGWSENPRPEMLDSLPNGDVLILDLFSECRPQYGAKNTIWYREKGYGEHEWCFCMLSNFGANIGMHGRMDQLIDNYNEARSSFSENMRGIGLTMEGSETNPIMYELMCELPWRKEKVVKHEWVKNYVKARYGKKCENVDKAWEILADEIYNCPNGNNQQGPHESIFCSRPSLDCFQSSSWSKMMNYYDPNSTIEAARL
nr:alpha-N-acetylglucosaminidase [Bacteroidaceae bacterium]